MKTIQQHTDIQLTQDITEALQSIKRMHREALTMELPDHHYRKFDTMTTLLSRAKVEAEKGHNENARELLQRAMAEGLLCAE